MNEFPIQSSRRAGHRQLDSVCNTRRIFKMRLDGLRDKSPKTNLFYSKTYRLKNNTFLCSLIENKKKCTYFNQFPICHSTPPHFHIFSALFSAFTSFVLDNSQAAGSQSFWISLATKQSGHLQVATSHCRHIVKGPPHQFDTWIHNSTTTDSYSINNTRNPPQPAHKWISWGYAASFFWCSMVNRK